MKNRASFRTFSSEELESEVIRILAVMGGSDADASWVARLLIRANLRGHDSHGVIRIPQYFEACRRGQIVPGAQPEIAAEGISTARINGHKGFGQVTGRLAAELATEKATRMGTAAISAFGCNHVGRLADYVELMADRGLVGFAFANDAGANQVVAPFGGLEGRLSTNPVAIAVPAKPFPLSLDIATSVAAMGKVAVRRNRGEPIPPGWLQDAEGNPTTDPEGLEASPPATLLPMAGYKGYALAVMIEILSGILTGAGYSQKEPSPDLQGLFLLAVKVEDFLDPKDFLFRVHHLTDYLKTSRPRPGCSDVLVPGELEWRTQEQRAREGIPIDLLTWKQIEGVKRSLGLA